VPRLSSRLQIAPFGTRNPSFPGRTAVPAIQQRGPAQAQELFPEVADPNTRRGLQSLQQAIARATSQAKSAPFARSNILHGVPLVNGGANGASPTLIAHGLGVPATGAVLLATYGGYSANPLVIIPNPSNVPPSIIQVWTQLGLFAGVSTVTGDILVYA
jgi:hypothetical protein